MVKTKTPSAKRVRTAPKNFTPSDSNQTGLFVAPPPMSPLLSAFTSVEPDLTQKQAAAIKKNQRRQMLNNGTTPLGFRRNSFHCGESDLASVALDKRAPDCLRAAYGLTSRLHPSPDESEYHNTTEIFKNAADTDHGRALAILTKKQHLVKFKNELGTPQSQLNQLHGRDADGNMYIKAVENMNSSGDESEVQEEKKETAASDGEFKSGDAGDGGYGEIPQTPENEYGYSDEEQQEANPDLGDPNQGGCPVNKNPDFEQPTKQDESSSSGSGGVEKQQTVESGVHMGSKTAGTFGHNPYQSHEAVPQFEENVTQEETGDVLNDVPTRLGGEKTTLRPRFGMQAASGVVPSAKEQIKSDIRFDMFDTVSPGFGEGTDNKLFVMETNRDSKIIYDDPLFAPGSNIGPEAGVQVSSWKLQRTMPTEKMALYSQSVKTNLQLIAEIVQTTGSTNLTGDDIGYYSTESSKGLKRKRISPFEPVVNNAMQFQSVKTPCGADLGQYQRRLLTDAMRYPRHLSSYTNGMGGPTLNKRRSLEIILR